MNKKFKYKKSLLAAILSATLLAGCDGGGSGSSSDTPPVDSGTGSLPEVKPDPTPNPEPTPEPTPDPEPTPEPIPDPEPTPEPEPEPVPTKTGYLTLGGSLRVTGDITCNDESSDGFTFTPGDKVTCVAGNNTTIATFDTQSEAARSLRAVEKVSFSLEDAQELAGSDNKKSNALSLVTSMNSCPANTEQVCLEFSSVIESKRFDSLYKQIDLAPEEFKKLVNEEVENNAATDKAPSTHTSPVVPATTPGTKPDLNASFVSATTINPDTNGDLSTLAQLLSGFSGTAVGVVKGDWMALVQEYQQALWYSASAESLALSALSLSLKNEKRVHPRYRRAGLDVHSL